MGRQTHLLAKDLAQSLAQLAKGPGAEQHPGKTPLG